MVEQWTRTGRGTAIALRDWEPIVRSVHWRPLESQYCAANVITGMQKPPTNLVNPHVSQEQRKSIRDRSGINHFSGMCNDFRPWLQYYRIRPDLHMRLPRDPMYIRYAFPEVSHRPQRFRGCSGKFATGNSVCRRFQCDWRFLATVMSNGRALNHTGCHEPHVSPD